MSSSLAHDNLRDETLLLVSQSRLAVVWSNETGLVRAFDNPDRIFFTGLKGAPDILGILLGGWWLGIEIKSGHGKLRVTQINFRNVIEKFGGLFIVGRSPEQVLQEIRAYLNARNNSTSKR